MISYLHHQVKGDKRDRGVVKRWVGRQRWRVENNKFDLQNKKKRDEREREKKSRERGDREEEEISSSLESGGRKERRRETPTLNFQFFLIWKRTMEMVVPMMMI